MSNAVASRRDRPDIPHHHQMFVCLLPVILCEDSGTDGVHTSALIHHKICAENENLTVIIALRVRIADLLQNPVIEAPCDCRANIKHYTTCRTVRRCDDFWEKCRECWMSLCSTACRGTTELNLGQRSWRDEPCVLICAPSSNYAAQSLRGGEEERSKEQRLCPPVHPPPPRPWRIPFTSVKSN